MSTVNSAEGMDVEMESLASHTRHEPNSHVDDGQVQLPDPQPSNSFPALQPPKNINNGNTVTDTCCVMQQQANISELMMKQHKGATLQPLDIPTFKGDLLDYQLLIRALE